MRFLVDTNILLYAVNTAAPENAAARRFFHDAAARGTPWCVTWSVIYEFLRVSTHHRVFAKPLDAERAWGFVEALLRSGMVGILQPTDRHASVLHQTLAEHPSMAGNLFHDFHTAVLLREHGVSEIITADTDFLQFRFLKVTNPIRPQ